VPAALTKPLRLQATLPRLHLNLLLTEFTTYYLSVVNSDAVSEELLEFTEFTTYYLSVLETSAPASYSSETASEFTTDKPNSLTVPNLLQVLTINCFFAGLSSETVTSRIMYEDTFFS
jgi:hypothetical protein